ncbi:MAG: glycosyltransferase family 2 protein, partial [bacterium]|nr:glycosyltransferase family 2 protein [bacterium]
GFPKKRNWLLQTYAFQTEWVLFLDADEHLTDAFKVALAEAVQQTGFVGYWLNYHNRFMGRTLKHGIPQRKLALFRVGAGIYERIDDNRWSKLDMEVHEHPVLDGAVSEIGESIDHFGYRGLHHFIDRHNDYSSWEAQRFVALTSAPAPAGASMTARQRRKYRHLDKMWFPFAYFGLAYFGRAGFLDGRAGLTYALLKSHYFWQIRRKILEIQADGR